MPAARRTAWRSDYAEIGTTETRTVQSTSATRAACWQSRSPPARAASGVVVVTERLEPYEEAERLALIVSLVTGVLPRWPRR